MDTKEIETQLHTSEKKRNSFALPFVFPMWLIFVIACLCIGILYIALKDQFFFGYPKLTDIIIDSIALGGNNKTGEWEFFWALTWIGCFICLGLFVCKHFLEKNKEKNSSSILSGKAANITLSQSKFFHVCNCLVIFIPVLLQTILYTKNVLYLWMFSFIFYLIAVVYHKNSVKLISLYLVLYFDIQTVVTLLSITHIVTILQDFMLFLIPTLLFFILLVADCKGHFLTSFISNRKLLLLQVPLPLLMLLYTKNTYLYQGQMVSLSFPITYIAIIWSIIIILFVIFIFEYKRSNQGITYSTTLSIFLYSSYYSVAQIVPTDMHHYGEQMLPYMQIADFSAKAYEEYMPVSGLFPIIPGALNAILFGGKATTFFATFSVFMIIFAAVTIFLIRKHIPSEYALILAFIFHMPNYCRTWIILPALLLLLLPCIRKDKRRFLYVYVMCGFLSGLYYPLYGLAIICAGLPYAFACLITYCKEKNFTTDIKSKSFYLESIVLFAPIAVSIPLLLRMAKHILAYSHQTILADGLALGGIDVPDWFMYYMTNDAFLNHLRTFAYYAIRFLAPMLPVWFCLLLLCNYIRINYIQKGHSLDAFLNPAFLGVSGSFIILPVCYTYSLVIMDESWVSKLFSRSGHIYWAMLGMFLPIILFCYGKEILGNITSTLLIALCIGFGMISFNSMRDYEFPVPDGTTNMQSQIVGQYTDSLSPFSLPDDAIFITAENQDAFPRLGTGFISKSILNYLYKYQNNLAILKFADNELSVLGLDSHQLYYYLLDEKVPYSGKPSLAKSVEAAESVLPFITEHTVVGSDIRSLNNYYIYKLLMEKGYIYDPLTEFYLPKSIYNNLYGELAYATASTKVATPFSASVYMVKIPAVLASNLSNLSNTLTRCDKPNDFLYATINKETLEQALQTSLAADSILCIRLDVSQDQVTDDAFNCIYIDFENGEWLLPLGTNENYIKNPSDEIYISLFDPANTTNTSNAENEADIRGIRLKEICDSYQFYQISNMGGFYENIEQKNN